MSRFSRFLRLSVFEEDLLLLRPSPLAIALGGLGGVLLLLMYAGLIHASASAWPSGLEGILHLIGLLVGLSVYALVWMAFTHARQARSQRLRPPAWGILFAGALAGLGYAAAVHSGLAVSPTMWGDARVEEATPAVRAAVHGALIAVVHVVLLWWAGVRRTTPERLS